MGMPDLMMHLYISICVYTIKRGMPPMTSGVKSAKNTVDVRL